MKLGERNSHAGRENLSGQDAILKSPQTAKEGDAFWCTLPRIEVLPPLSFFEKCSILDDMPVAYCVIELVFDEDGHGVDFVFRYCNKHMKVVEGIPVEEMLNRSFYEVFKNGDRKWLIAYADVALNGVQRTLHDYSPEIDKNLTIYCYQPQPGYCACVLVPE